MLGLSDIISKHLEKGVADIQKNMDGIDFNASGQTKGSLNSEVTEGTGYVRGIIQGAASLEWAETGRPPRTSTEDSGLTSKIYDWMGYRGIGSDLTEKGKQGLARFITLKINRLGTKLYREKRRRDVYSSVLTETVENIRQDIGEELANFTSQQFTKTFK